MARTSQQNGISKRENRSIVEMGLSMLRAKDLPRSFWVEAVNTVVHILNGTMTKAIEGKTPEEAYSGRKPITIHLKVFGSIAFVSVHKDTRTKLDPRSTNIGYSKESKAYRLYDKEAKKIMVSHDVESLERMWLKRTPLPLTWTPLSKSKARKWWSHPVTQEMNEVQYQRT